MPTTAAATFEAHAVNSDDDDAERLDEQKSALRDIDIYEQEWSGCHVEDTKDNERVLSGDLGDIKHHTDHKNVDYADSKLPELPH